MQRSLAELETFASATTKQLDDTYYSVLEKLNALQNTVAALKDLAEQSNQLNSTFSSEADELVTDVSAQLDAFEQFDDQQKRIESLQNRIEAGRELIRSLSERVDAVSERIESWGRADREWQEKTRKRLKAVWIVTSVVVFLMLSLLIGSQYLPDGLDETASRVPGDGLNSLKDAVKADTLLSSLAGQQRSSHTLNTTDHSGISSPRTDMLRAFDEL